MNRKVKNWVLVMLSIVFVSMIYIRSQWPATSKLSTSSTTNGLTYEMTYQMTQDEHIHVISSAQPKIRGYNQ